MASTSRRTLLRTAGVALASGLAGCPGGGAGGDGGGTTVGGGTTAGEGRGTTSAAPATALAGRPSIRSTAFADGEPIPTRFTCEGENVSPPIEVADVPDAAASLALLVDDPDAPSGTFTHWLLWDLPPSTSTIAASVPRGETVAPLGGAKQGTNDAGQVGYSGPCPPTSDGAHGYRFRLFALGDALDLDPAARRPAFDDALSGVATTEAVLHGTFDR